jgi:hypothetical protein
MTQQVSIGLVIAGPLSRFPLARVRAFADRVGPIHSTSRRLASRYSGLMRAGRSEVGWEAFNHCNLIFVSVPDELFEVTVDEMAAAPVSWKSRAVVVWHPRVNSDELRALARRQASTASLCDWPSARSNLLLFEGAKLAQRHLRVLTRATHHRLITVSTPGKPLVDAICRSTSAMMASLVEASDRAFRGLSVRPADILPAVEVLVGDALRAHGQAGRKNWRSAYPADELRNLIRELAPLDSFDAQVAVFLRQHIAAACVHLRDTSPEFEQTGQPLVWTAGGA